MSNITVDGITKTYGDITAVDDVSFDIEEGEIVGLLGPNGAGKTSTIRIMTGYLHPDEGSVSVAGCDMLKQGTEARKHLGYVPEFSPVYEDMNVTEYLRFIGETRGIPKRQVIKRIRSLSERCGIDDVLQRRIGYLSKGYQQRVCLAQALIHNPEFLILDEPTTGLDPNQVLEFRDLIREVGQDHTVLLSTHILQEVTAICNRIMVIHRGEIVADGTEEELLEEFQKDQYYLTLRTKNGKSRDEIKSRLSGEDRIQSVEEESTDDQMAKYTVEFGDLQKTSGEQADELLTRLIREEDWIVNEMRPDRPSLEKVFVELTQD